MGKEVERAPANAVDQALLKNAASMSPAELSKSINGLMNPAQVASHVKKLLADKNWLAETELDNLNTYKLQVALEQLEKGIQDTDKLGMQLKFLKEIGNRLDKRRAATQVDLNALYGNQGAIMAAAYDIALSYIRGAFREEIDAEVWDEVARDALDHARNELAKHEIAD